jgi:hypothetical protein
VRFVLGSKGERTRVHTQIDHRRVQADHKRYMPAAEKQPKEKSYNKTGCINQLIQRPEFYSLFRIQKSADFL